MRCQSLFLLTLSILPGIALADSEVKGRIFYDQLDPKSPSFFFLSQISKDGALKKVVSTYTDKQGKPLVVEESEFDGDRLVRYVYKQQQVNENGEVTFKDDKVLFTFTDAKKTDSESENYDSSMIVAPMIGDVLSKNWTTLMNGDSVKVRYLAIERLETIGFKFFKDKERSLRGHEAVDFIMKPSSIFIAALVTPIRITVTKDEPHWIMESNGRTPIRYPAVNPPTSRKDWKAIDARVEYDQAKELKNQPATKPTKAKKTRRKHNPK